MKQRYVFDKREMKKLAKTFAIKIAIAFPFILIVMILTQEWNIWASYGLAILVGLLVYGVCSWIWYMIQKEEPEEKQNSKKKK